MNFWRYYLSNPGIDNEFGPKTMSVCLYFTNFALKWTMETSFMETFSFEGHSFDAIFIYCFSFWIYSKNECSCYMNGPWSIQSYSHFAVTKFNWTFSCKEKKQKCLCIRRKRVISTYIIFQKLYSSKTIYEKNITTSNLFLVKS